MNTRNTPTLIKHEPSRLLRNVDRSRLTDIQLGLATEQLTTIAINFGVIIDENLNWTDQEPWKWFTRGGDPFNLEEEVQVFEVIFQDCSNQAQGDLNVFHVFKNATTNVQQQGLCLAHPFHLFTHLVCIEHRTPADVLEEPSYSLILFKRIAQIHQ
uniref:Uncharacterized protein n=1 Tax=Timema poppense TaxID=170557 RepID=A0A7R9DHH0_TIMPO|nr:unnamed protein product [Timema poppensis]